MLYRTLILALALPIGATYARAQDTLLFVTDATLSALGPTGALFSAGSLNDDEVGMVTPGAGSYSASAFLSISSQWAFIGDIDTDGDFFESSSGPGLGTNAILINRLQPAPAQYGPRDVYVSKESTTGFDSANFADGDVFRFTSQGVIEFFVRESELVSAIGQGGSGNVDLDAICMDFAANLYLSFNSTETVGGTSALDGALIYIDASNITYDASGNIASIAPNTAVIAASEADIAAMIVNSGVRDGQATVPPTTSSDVELSALEFDFGGGQWTAPQVPSLTLPNLIFSWDDTETEGAILSTAGGGSIAVINGIPMGSTDATIATHLGLRPSSSTADGVMGLGVIPQRLPVLALEIWPVISFSSSSPLLTRQELSGATPGAPVGFFIDFPVGNVHPAIAVPGFTGAIYGAGALLPVATVLADTNGNATNELVIPPATVGTGLAVVWQAIDLTTATFAWPGATDF